MPAGRLELPKATLGRLGYSQEQLPLCDAGRTNGIQLSKNKRSESFRTQSAETARSFCLTYRTGIEIFGSGNPLPLDQIWRRK